MCASLFLCPLKRVVRVTSPASLSFAPASPTPLRGLRLSPAGPYRPRLTPRLCVVRRIMFLAWPAPILGPALLQGSAPVEHAPLLRPCRARRRPPRRSPAALRVPSSWDPLRPSGSAPAASPRSGPHLFEDLCALVTPDSLDAIAGDQRAACLCQSLAARWLSLLFPSPLDSAQSPPTPALQA